MKTFSQLHIFFLLSNGQANLIGQIWLVGWLIKNGLVPDLALSSIFGRDLVFEKKFGLMKVQVHVRYIQFQVEKFQLRFVKP